MKKYYISVFVLFGMLWGEGLFAVHDPTKPENIVEIQGADSWNLTAIFISDQKKTAVMQGNLVTIGSKVDEAEVKDIQPEFVLLKTKEGMIRIFLISTQIKIKPVTN